MNSVVHISFFKREVMKNSCIILMMTFALTYFVCAPANAQQKEGSENTKNGIIATVGVVGGYLSPIFTGSAGNPAPLYPGEVWGDMTSQPVDASAFFAGISLTPGFLPELAIQVFVEDVNGARYIERDEEPLPSRVFDENGRERRVLSSTENEAKVDFTALTARIQYEYELPWLPIRLIGGVSPSYITSSRAQRFFRMIDPPEGRFIPDESLGFTYSDDFRTIMAYDDEISGLNTFRIGLHGALAYAISVGKFEFIPFTALNFGMTDLSTSGDWGYNALQIGLDTRLHL